MIDEKGNLNPNKNHSRLGIASVIIGLIVPIVIILLLVIVKLLGTKSGSIGDSISFGSLIFAISAPVLHLVGLVFGVIGWVSKKTKNLFAIIGTILNAVLGLLGILLIILIIYMMIIAASLILH